MGAPKAFEKKKSADDLAKKLPAPAEAKEKESTPNPADYVKLATESDVEAPAEKYGSEGSGKSSVTAKAEKVPMPLCTQDGAWAVCVEGQLNILLIAAPVAIAAKMGGWDSGVEFAAALIAICPLAERLGFVTEELAKHTSDTIGGLLNATFGNATEVIVSFFAIRSGLLRVVQLSLLGSVLSNMLLVLGTAWFVGGLRHESQSFNMDGIGQNFGLLMMSVASCCLPCALVMTGTEVDPGISVLSLSRFSSCLMLTLYLAFIAFQLITHAHLYDEGGGGDEDDDDGEDPAVLSFCGGILWLTLITVVISILSEALVDSIEGAAAYWGCSISFISTVLIPIVGNAAEHAGAVVFAVKNKMDMSLGIAVGSSTQIALFVLPLCVLVAWASDQPLDLNLQGFESVTLLVTVLTVALACTDGKSNWLKGMALMFAYFALSAAFWLHEDKSLNHEDKVELENKINAGKVVGQ